MRSSGCKFAIVVVCAALTSRLLCSQGAARIGKVVLGLDQKMGGAAVAAPQRQQALTIASKLRDILERDPAIASPAGFSVRIHRAYGKRTDWADFDSGLRFYAAAYAAFFGAEVKPSCASPKLHPEQD